VRPLVTATAREALIVTIAAAALGIGMNALREDRIPLIASPEDFAVSTKAELIRIEDARRLFDEGRAVFIDARSREIFVRQHIEGALNIEPTSNVANLGWLSQTDSYLITYASSTTQGQAGVVADRLIEMGCTNVYVLRGGFEAWLEAGLPIEESR